MIHSARLTLMSAKRQVEVLPVEMEVVLIDRLRGGQVFQNVFQGSLKRKTRVLVTHALHFLNQVDYIITLVDGHVAERGTYEELMAKDGAFAKFLREFGTDEVRKEEEDHDEDDAAKKHNTAGPADEKVEKKVFTKGQSSMQAEERNTSPLHMAG
jgi:ABC-type multidrug transport system ATPase subunit